MREKSWNQWIIPRVWNSLMYKDLSWIKFSMKAWIILYTVYCTSSITRVKHYSGIVLRNEFLMTCKTSAVTNISYISYPVRCHWDWSVWCPLTRHDGTSLGFKVYCYEMNYWLHTTIGTVMCDIDSVIQYTFWMWNM